MGRGYPDLVWALDVTPIYSPTSGFFPPFREPEVRYERVVRTITLEVFVCDYCGAKYQEWTTKCPNCGGIMSGRKETL
jgi:hypothetical protein